MFQGLRVLLIIGGGIAAYKTLELVRRLRESGASVRAILTEGGAQFVTPLSLGALTGDHVYGALFDLTDEARMGHIQLSRDADLLVVAPATADLMAKMTAGLAGDLATTALLATDKPVLIAPAMNVRMWLHPATQANLATLLARGVRVVGPDDGPMACGEHGPGRMAEPDAILAAIRRHAAARGLLAGLSAVVTAGPTHEPIDPVRFLANRSSGKQGFAIASALADAGADTTLVTGPVTLPAPAGMRTVRVTTAAEMLAATQAALPADIAVMTAAVADWRPAGAQNGKIKKEPGGAAPTLALTENPDILATLAAPGPRRPRLVIGFAAETDAVIAHAQAKLARKGCDWIVANDVTGGVMGGDTNTVHVVTRDGVEDWPELPKTAVAERLVARIAGALGRSGA